MIDIVAAVSYAPSPLIFTGGEVGLVARLVRGLDDEVWVQFGQLAVFFERNDGDIVLDSDGEDDLARVRLEAWDAAPPGPGAPWIPVENTTVEGGTGFVTVGSVAEQATQSLLIGPPHFLYGVAVHTQEAGELPEYTTEEEFQRAWDNRELAQWLIRFWPIRDVFDPARHDRPDRGPDRVVREVELPVSAASDWAAARISRREAALEEWLARKGLTMADYLVAHGLAPDLPFDRIQRAMLERELPAVAERRGWPGWWTELVMKYPDIVDHWHRLPESDEDWSAGRREESARALARRSRTEELLNPDGRHTFAVDIQAHWPRPGGTYRGWRWDYADHPAEQTFGVDRRVVFEDVMSGKVLATGIVTVIGADGGQFVVRDAEPAEAARFHCAETAWSK